MNGPRNQVPTVAEFNQLRSHLQARHGLTAAQVDAVIGPAHAGRTRQQIAQVLTLWLKTRPHS